jgi:hypothetical protein
MMRRAFPLGLFVVNSLVERLLSDARVLGPSGIERIVWGVKTHGDGTDEAVAEAEKVLRESGREAEWRDAEAALRALTEGSHAQEAWRAEDPDADRTAEDALLHAGLAVVAGEQLAQEYRHALLKPAAEALPWLLPEERPDEGPRPDR